MGDVSLCVPSPKGYNPGGIDPLAGKPHPIWDSRRLWSLADMINFYIAKFLFARQQLSQEMNYVFSEAIKDRNAIVPDSSRPRIDNAIRGVIRECVAGGSSRCPRLVNI